ncbi:capsid and scaffold protein [Bacteriophage Phobos]|uniref:Capsid and scaffold protein n=1 Tax=Bacteriophage Phobos TaxID=2662138 RepID=A0A5Q2U9U8_9CAUD|nr:tail assembly protein [Bacteriophage Phobos]QGH45003.1 capsid and scaffold protein [Bacteriophage Phobos]WPK42399.1 capsid and scaffold protein [Pseudomonas phage Ppu-503]
MIYPFDPEALPVAGMTDLPVPDDWEATMAYRAMQNAAAAEPHNKLGVDTSVLRPANYDIEPGALVREINAATYNAMGKWMAQAARTLWDKYPHELNLEPNNPNRYSMAGETWSADPDMPVNFPTMEWFYDFFRELFALKDPDGKRRPFVYINSVAYEILNFFMKEDWKQRNLRGEPALSGWVPPSCFIRPTSPDALDYMARVQIQVLRVAMQVWNELEAELGTDYAKPQWVAHPVRFQIGEPWWWDGSYTNGAPCIYDAATIAQYHAETGLKPFEPWIDDVYQPARDEDLPYLYWLRDKLGESTNAIRDAVKAVFPSMQATLLFFTPQIMSVSSGITNIMNMPTDHWRNPNYDFVQIEDYDWIIDGRLDKVPLTFDAAEVKLGYPRSVVHYFVGFVNLAQDTQIWTWIDKATRMAQDIGMPFIYVWSYTQVMREDVLYYELPPAPLEAPIFDLPPNWSSEYRISRDFFTEVIDSRSAREQRRALRQSPRKQVDFSCLMTDADMRRFGSFMQNWQGYPFYMPELTTWVATKTDLAPGAIRVELEVPFGPNNEDPILPYWVQLGSVVLVRTDAGWTARLVDRIDYDDLPDPATGQPKPLKDRRYFVEFRAQEDMAIPAGSRLYLAMWGRFGAQISSRHHTSSVMEVGMNFVVEPGSEGPLWRPSTPLRAWEGVEVFPFEPNWRKPLDQTSRALLEQVDYQFGRTATFHPVQFNVRDYKMTFHAMNLWEAEQVIAFYERMKGQQNVFWCPTFLEDMVIDPRTTTDEQLHVLGTEIADNQKGDPVLNRIAIKLLDGTYEFFKVLNMARTPDGQSSTLVLDRALGQNVRQNLVKISWCPLCRLTTDRLLMAFLTDGVAQFDLAITTLETSET